MLIDGVCYLALEQAAGVVPGVGEVGRLPLGERVARGRLVLGGQ